MGTLLVLKNLLNQPVETVSFFCSVLERMIQSNSQLSLINLLLRFMLVKCRVLSCTRNPQIGIVVQGILEEHWSR